MIFKYYNLIPCILGFLFSIIIGVLVLGLDSFIVFIKMTFFEIPAWSSLMSDYVYPSFTFKNLFPYWLPIISLLLIIIYFLNNYIFFKKNNNRRYLFYIYFILLSIFSYKGALGRSDYGHILYVSHYIVICIFMIIDAVCGFKKQYLDKFICLIFLLLMFSSQYFDINKIINIPEYSLSDIKITLSLPKISDNYWLNSEQIMVRDYILENSNENDNIFVFTNEAAYYYLTKRKNPTRFYINWFMEANIYHNEIIGNLENNKPKYIIYKSNFWGNSPDFIPNDIRLKYINSWILNNYHKDIIIGSTNIYKKNY